jgi:hypothetical protein
MANPELKATPDIVVVDAASGETTGTMYISYVAGSFLGPHRAMLGELAQQLYDVSRCNGLRSTLLHELTDCDPRCGSVIRDRPYDVGEASPTAPDIVPHRIVIRRIALGGLTATIASAPC